MSQPEPALVRAFGSRPSCGAIMSGTQASVRMTGITPVKPRGATPMTVYGAPFTMIRRPTIAESAPKRRSQNPWLSTITGWAPGTVRSSPAKNRPMAGRTPSTSK